MDDHLGQITAVHGGEAISNDRQVSGPFTNDHTEVTTTMQRKTRRIIAAVAVIALLAAGGAAFTDSIQGLDGNTATAGFGAETVAGATANSVNYKLSADGQYMDQVVVDLQGDQSASTFVANLTGAGGAIVKAGVCTAGSFTTGTPGDTSVSCDFTTGGNGAADTGEAVNAVQGFELSVTNNGGDSSGSSETYNGS
jgi:hypothetical protein